MSNTDIELIDEPYKRVMPKSTGRPTKVTQEVIRTLEQAYLNDATDVQACLMAGISEDTLQRYMKRNPSFRERKKALASNMALQAKLSLLKHIPRDGKLALDVVERLEKERYSLRTELTGAEGKDFTFKFVEPKE